MSAFNPFRARNVDDLFTKPIQPPVSPLPNGYPRKSALSLEIEDHESSSSSSDEQTADPFNPDSAVSDNEDDERNDEHSRSFASPTDHHPRDPVGSAPHPAPSEEGSTTVPPLKALSTQVSTTEVGRPNTAKSSTPSLVQPVGSKSPENDGNTSSSSRADKEKRPPPPPKSHHGKRINNSNSTSRPESSRSTDRRSFHASSPESVTSVQPPGMPNANAGSPPPPAPDYFLTPSDHQQASGSTDSLQRSHSQSKRPPTPPLSRRHSQMRRSKSTQSKSSNSRLTMSSIDSESNDICRRQPLQRPELLLVPQLSPHPGPRRTHFRHHHQHLAPGQHHYSLADAPHHMEVQLLAPSLEHPLHRHPPRRARDSILRASDGGAEPPATQAETPLPQPSNATDILADLSRLQKEVDDLRGHYESRKVSQ
ncbi:hypothetical protein N7533_000957 [Penicillium manginii]|uniref:uncharacterized protein n=1 Tax=Penicillium manginii TaxID=203109 RepID=UPI0025492CD7|nr:uncharacterized protein N7533_000957 [Penicillium manginii]KAJ5768374.1 hypothetical protein N7533_000957 [Penicillium manginii]